MSSEKSISIGVILGSSRKPRVNPQVTDFVTETFKEWSTSQSTTIPELKLIDLAEWNLPMFDESGLPQMIHDPAKYDHEHTRAWSAEIQKHAAFIFVSPQYNHGYPAVLKNAIDFLFNEWTKKPALVVTYGGHGGSQCNEQLRRVLLGIKMQLTQIAPALTFPSREILMKAVAGQDIGALGKDSIWNSEREILSKSFEELIALLPQEQPAKDYQG